MNYYLVCKSNNLIYDYTLKIIIFTLYLTKQICPRARIIQITTKVIKDKEMALKDQKEINTNLLKE
jgi:hypothetical protein